MENINKQYDKLGGKTLALFILKRSGFLFVILIAIALIFGLQGLIPTDYSDIVQLVLLGLAIAFVVFGLIVFGLGMLEYKHYKIIISDETIKIYRGVFSEEEIGLPFRRIKQVNIERSLTDEIFGISNINLTVLGGEDGDPMTKSDKIIISVIDKNIAEEIQNIILKESEVEEINVAPSK